MQSCQHMNNTKKKKISQPKSFRATHFGEVDVNKVEENY